MLRVLLLLPFLASAAAANECGKLTTRAGVVGYCVNESDASQNPDILYYLHGAAPADASDVERSFADGEPDLMKLWAELHRAAPSTIAISWGPRWTLKGDKLDAFERDIVPALEAKLPPAGNRRRLILGASMGGLSAFIAWTRLPHLFSAAAFQCPAFTPLGPRASRFAKWYFAKTHPNVRPAYVDMLATIFEPDFKTAEEWDSYQPPDTMRAMDTRGFPPVYIVYDSKDELGLNSAPEIAASAPHVTYERIEGGHCTGIFTEGLARFLSNRPLDATAAR